MDYFVVKNSSQGQDKKGCVDCFAEKIAMTGGGWIASSGKASSQGQEWIASSGKASSQGRGEIGFMKGYFLMSENVGDKSNTSSPGWIGGKGGADVKGRLAGACSLSSNGFSPEVNVACEGCLQRQKEKIKSRGGTTTLGASHHFMPHTRESGLAEDASQSPSNRGYKYVAKFVGPNDISYDPEKVGELDENTAKGSAILEGQMQLIVGHPLDPRMVDPKLLAYVHWQVTGDDVPCPDMIKPDDYRDLVAWLAEGDNYTYFQKLFVDAKPLQVNKFETSDRILFLPGRSGTAGEYVMMTQKGYSPIRMDKESGKPDKYDAAPVFRFDIMTLDQAVENNKVAMRQVALNAYRFGYLLYGSDANMGYVPYGSDVFDDRIAGMLQDNQKIQGDDFGKLVKILGLAHEKNVKHISGEGLPSFASLLLGKTKNLSAEDIFVMSFEKWSQTNDRDGVLATMTTWKNYLTEKSTKIQSGKVSSVEKPLFYRNADQHILHHLNAVLNSKSPMSDEQLYWHLLALVKWAERGLRDCTDMLGHMFWHQEALEREVGKRRKGG